MEIKVKAHIAIIEPNEFVHSKSLRLYYEWKKEGSFLYKKNSIDLIDDVYSWEFDGKATELLSNKSGEDLQDMIKERITRSITQDNKSKESKNILKSIIEEHNKALVFRFKYKG